MYKLLGFLILVYVCLNSNPVFAEISYEVIGTKDISYVNVERGVIRVRINNNLIPSESELKQISKEVWKKNRGRWQIGTVFFLVKDMPADSMAYAASEFTNSKIKEFWVNAQALTIHEYIKSQNESTKEQKSKKTVNIAEDDNLTIGGQYILKKRTKLMPNPTPEKGVDGLMKSLKEVKNLEPSNTILVTMKQTIGSTLWYQVVAYKDDGDQIGRGWINSGALIGQKLRKE